MTEYPPDAIKVLDHGFVRLVDVMGNDASIVQAARVSYGQGTKSVSSDEGLIRYLMRQQHTTPFEMVEFKFHCRMPIFVARQWIRHRTANVNETSGRYSEMVDVFYVPDSKNCTKQSGSNRQGGEEALVETASTIPGWVGVQNKLSYSIYQTLLSVGLRRELARVVLPTSIYTEWYWKNDLHNLFHFLKLRLDTHAQYEIRMYAEAMASLIKPIVPVAWKAFEDYTLNAIKFSGIELKFLHHILMNRCKEPAICASDAELCDWIPNTRERSEFQDKLRQLGVPIDNDN